MKTSKYSLVYRKQVFKTHVFYSQNIYLLTLVTTFIVCKMWRYCFPKNKKYLKKSTKLFQKFRCNNKFKDIFFPFKFKHFNFKSDKDILGDKDVIWNLLCTLWNCLSGYMTIQIRKTQIRTTQIRTIQIPTIKIRTIQIWKIQIPTTQIRTLVLI